MPSELFLNPLEIMVLFVIGLLALMPVWKHWVGWGSFANSGAWLLSVYAISYLVIILHYANSAGFFDHGEAMVPAWSWMLNEGKPLYNGFEDAARYSTIYGPIGNIYYALAMKWFGASLHTCKMAAALAGIGCVVLTFLAYAKLYQPRTGFIGGSLVSLGVLAFAFQSFMTKHDPLLFLFTALGLYATVAFRPLIGSIMLGLCAGCLMNGKAHAVLYVVPLLLLRPKHFRVSHFIFFSCAAVLAFVLPFFHQQISFSDWLAGLSVEGGLGIGRTELFSNVQWFALIWFPVPALMFALKIRDAAAFRELMLEGKWFILATFVASVLIGLVGSKIASGPAHFAPLIPVVFCIYCMLLPAIGSSVPKKASQDDLTMLKILASVLVACFLTWNVIAVHQQYRLLSALKIINTNSTLIYADINDIVKQLPGKSVSMGYGSSQTTFLSQHFLPLVFAGNPYYFNFSSMMGFHGHFLSVRSRAVIKDKLVDYWLVPRGDQPFTIRSYYQPNPELFDEDFRKAFAENYVHKGASRFFDVYEAKGVNP